MATRRTRKRRRLRVPPPPPSSGGGSPPPSSSGGSSGGSSSSGGGTSGGGSPSNIIQQGKYAGMTPAQRAKAIREEKKAKAQAKREKRGDIKTYLAAAQKAGYKLTKQVRKLAQKAERGNYTVPAFLFDLERTAAGKKITEAEEAADASAYLDILAALDISLTPELQALVDNAVNTDMSETAFEYLIRQTQNYKDRYPGILPGMSEDEYLGLEGDYAGIAGEYGYAITPAQIAHAIANHITPETLGERLEAIRVVTENKDYYDEFNEVLASKGMAPLTLEGQVEFAMGNAPNQIYDLWEQASIQQAAEAAGLDTSLITQTDIDALLARPGRIDIDTAAELFGGIVEKVRTLIPMSQLANFNITERDIVEMELDPLNERSFTTAKTLQQAIANVEAQKEQELASTPLEPDIRQQTTRRPQQATV